MTPFTPEQEARIRDMIAEMVCHPSDIQEVATMQALERYCEGRPVKAKIFGRHSPDTPPDPKNPRSAR